MIFSGQDINDLIRELSIDIVVIKQNPIEIVIEIRNRNGNGNGNGNIGKVEIIGFIVFLCVSIELVQECFIRLQRSYSGNNLG